MSEDTGKQLLFVTFLIAIVLAAWSEIHTFHRLPVPKRFVSVAIVWAMLGLAAPFISYPLAGSLALGLSLPLWYQAVPQKKGS